MCLGEETAKQAIHEHQCKKVWKQLQKKKNKLTVLEIIIEFYARGFSFLPIDLYMSLMQKIYYKREWFNSSFSFFAGVRRYSSTKYCRR